MTVPTVHEGFPPGMLLVWDVWHWVFRPDPDNPPSYATLGPPGDQWLFTEDQAISHMQGGWELEIAKAAFRIRLIDGVGTFTVPKGLEFPVKWIRASILANVGSSERLEHTFSLIRTDGSDPPTDAAGLLTVANKARDDWLFALQPNKGELSSELVYQHVVVQSLQLDVPFVSGGNNKGKISQNGPTVLSGDFGPTGLGTGGTPLPYEVACCVTLRTRAAQAGGVSHGRRNRGRTYIGCIATSALSGAGGVFDDSSAFNMGHLVWTFCQGTKDADLWEVAVVSKVGLIAHEVNKVEVGRVPDVIRRRRDQQTENYQTVGEIP